MAIATHDDARTKLAVKFARGPERPPLVAAMRSGLASSILDPTLRDIEHAASKFGPTVADIRSSPNVSRAGQAQRIGESAAQFLQVLKQAAGKLAAEQERVTNWAMSASFVKPYDASVPYHVVQADQGLMAKFERMAPHEQAALVAQATHEPATHLRWVEAFLRTPAELSGLNYEQRNQMRVETLRVFDKATYSAIDTQTEEIAQTREALRAAAGMVRDDAPGAWTEFMVTDPQTAAALQGQA